MKVVVWGVVASGTALAVGFAARIASPLAKAIAGTDTSLTVNVAVSIGIILACTTVVAGGRLWAVERRARHLAGRNERLTGENERLTRENEGLMRAVETITAERDLLRLELARSGPSDAGGLAAG
jgi:hypothetical protein